MIAVCAVVFVVVYEQTGNQLDARVADDVHGDVTQMAGTLRTLDPTTSTQLVAHLRMYIDSQPYSRASALLFAIVPGHGTISNHPELFGSDRPDRGETSSQQREENVEGHALLTGPLGQRTAIAPDVGLLRIDVRELTVAGTRVRLGAGESLQTVARAQHGVARSFLLAGAIALVLVLLASYLAGVVATRPIRRLAAVAARVGDGDLYPRMYASHRSAREIQILADAFNHMLDRLEAAFARQREFVADASHELRTPLTVIAGQLEVLARRADPDHEEVERTQRLVAGEVARTARLVDDLVLLTSADHEQFLRRREIDLPGFVTDLWETTTAGRARRFDLGPIPDGVLDADPDRLAQALRNLIDNALAHTREPDGHVSLAITTRAGGWIRFTVEDDGPGIPADQRDLVFERFHRVDEARDRHTGGAGLGLSIAQAIATAHGGHIRAAESSSGACLELDLPRFSMAPTPPPSVGTGKTHGLGR